MASEALNHAVERLFCDGRFRRRFRRNPERALRGSGLSGREVEALKRGRAEELLTLGLDPSFIWPTVTSPGPMHAWLLRNARRLAPVALLAATLAFPAGGAAQEVLPPGRRRAARRLVGFTLRRRSGLVRAFVRTGGRARGITHAARRAGLTGTRQALRSLGVDPPEGCIICPEP